MDYSFVERSRKDNLRYIFLELTKKCNLRGVHCGSDCGASSGNELTTDQWKDFIRYIADNFSPKQIMFCITGGEPMVRSDFYDIVNEIHKYGFSWGLTTNGTLITREDVSKLKKAGMKTVALSVDGLKETHDSFRNQEGCFEKVLQAFKLLNKKYLFERVQITTVVSKRNIDEMDALYDLFSEYGVKDWRLASVDPIGRANDKSDILLSADDYDRLFDFISQKRHENSMHIQYGCAHFVPERFDYDVRDMKYKCGAGIHVASVLSNGDIFSCIDTERRPELIQGNILYNDFCKVWENGFTEFVGEHRIHLSKKCSECNNREMCQGDAAHTWDYEKNEPQICLFELLKEKRFNALNRCGNCHRELLVDAKYCEYCGAKRGTGMYNLFDFNDRDFQTLYGPPPEKCSYRCLDCGKKWEHWVMGSSETDNCPYCCSKHITYQRDKWY